MVNDFLSSNKKIYDSVHGFIRFDEYEKTLIDTYAFQRLRYINQLGVTYLVYPGATHNRFEHSLGVMELATQIFSRICKSIRPDVFSVIPRKGSSEYFYWEKVVRLAALCHDLGHLPFSHVAEKDLLKEDGHEKWTLNVIESPYLHHVLEKLSEEISFLNLESRRNIKEDVIKIAIGEQKLKKIQPSKKYSFSAWDKIVSQVIAGDFFGADRIDYLLRDARNTGIVYGTFDYRQLIESIRILPKIDGKKDELELGIDENGLESCEALLLARHFMHKRVYQYSGVKAYSFHLKRFMGQLFSKSDIFKNVENYLALSDVNVIQELTNAYKDPSHFGHEDAKKIITRKDHFKAISLPFELKEEDLKEFKSKNKIEDDKIAWEFNPSVSSDEGLCFPVSQKHLIIKKAKDCSSLLSKIPVQLNNWVYIAPEFELLFLQELKKFNK